MNKRDLATVLVRFAGLYFGYLAVRQIASVGYFTWVLSSLLGDIDDGIEITEKFSVATAFPGAISFFISAGIAYYLLKKGTWLIEFLSKDSTERPDGA